MKRLQTTQLILTVAFFAAWVWTAMAETIRSNGTGGGLWSAPTTWDDGKVPTNGTVTILGKDIVDLDSTGPKEIECDDLLIDPQGTLRVVGQNKSSVKITIHKSMRVFGNMIVDYSKDPESRCEFVWDSPEKGKPELQLNDGCRVLWKGAEDKESSNVVFRMPIPQNAPKSWRNRPVMLLIASRVWVQWERVAMDGFDVYVTGVDGTGLKYNEACAIRNCAFKRSSVTFRSCTKIEFDGNVMEDSPAFGITVATCSHSRIANNVVDRTNGPSGAIAIWGCGDCEFIGNTVRRSYFGINATSSGDLFFIDNHFEENRIGTQLNSCTRITSQRSTFSKNELLDIRATFLRPGPPWRFYDCVFQTPPTKPGGVSISVDGIVAVEIINSPLQTYAMGGKRGPLTFCAYLDVFVTNEQGEPLGRVPIRVLSEYKAIATSRTESVGPMTGHTPLPSSHRPLVLPWYRYAPSDASTKPVESIAYQLEVDGTSLGYAKQIVPLTMDASFVRTDPEKPTKTVTVKLVKGK